MKLLSSKIKSDFFYFYYILIFLFDFQTHSGILLAIYILLKITVEKNVCIDFELK